MSSTGRARRQHDLTVPSALEMPSASGSLDIVALMEEQSPSRREDKDILVREDGCIWKRNL